MTTSSAIDTLWRIGDLSYLLYGHQLAVDDRYHNAKGRKFVLNCNRRWGKSFWLCVRAVEQCLQQRRQYVRYAAPTAKMVRNIIEPHMATILQDCPEDLTPRYNRLDGVWKFPGTESELHVAGCDKGGADRLRGTDTHLGILDEGRDIDSLSYVIKDVIMPQTITVDGRIIIASSPSKMPEHPFRALCLEAEAQGNYIHQDIYDCDHITPEQIAEYAAESGGVHTSTWCREYLAQFVIDPDLAVVPEFDESVHVGAVERPKYFKPIVAADLGYHDLTAVLFGYYHFDRGIVVIEDELILRLTVGSETTRLTGEKALVLYRDSHHKPLYVADAPELVLAEMQRGEHRLPWMPAYKDDSDAALNALRTRFGGETIMIHPRCKGTIAHFKGAMWNRRRTDYERMEGLGHFDAVDAAKYLVRHTNRNFNPYPRGWNWPKDSFVSPKMSGSSATDYEKIFLRGRKLRRKRFAR